MAGEENIDGGRSDSRPSTVDLTKCLKAWPRKARNIRVPTLPPPVLDSPGVSSSYRNNDHSPHVLISSEASVQPDHLDSEEEKEKVMGVKRKLEGTEDGSGRGDKIRKTDSEVDSLKISDTEGADHDGEIRESEINIKNSDEISLPEKTSFREGCADVQAANIKNQVVSSVKENDDPTAPETPRRYACSFCSKTFSCHLAFGGHKSSHNKFKMVIYNGNDLRRKKQQSLITNTCDEQTGKIASSGENAASPREPVGDDRSTHTCKICLKKFPSGQALGGHQRFHRTCQKTQSAPKILDSDLTELTKEEDGDPSAKC